MTDINPLHTFWSMLFLIIMLFYLFRLVGSRRQIRHVDAENEVGHGIMALGMAFMLAPAGLLTFALLRWNIILFAAAALWWTLRLLVRKPLLALGSRTNKGETSVQADAIHVFMHVGMCYMFLLMSNMALSMTLLAASANCLFFVSFVFLLLLYGREIGKDLQTTRVDWLKLGADVAHALMSGAMSWMFIEMISMIAKQ